MKTFDTVSRGLNGIPGVEDGREGVIGERVGKFREVGSEII